MLFPLPTAGKEKALGLEEEGEEDSVLLYRIVQRDVCEGKRQGREMGAENWPQLCFPNLMSWLRTVVSQGKVSVKMVFPERHFLAIFLSGEGILFKNKKAALPSANRVLDE